MDIENKRQLQMTACKVRMGVIEGTHSAKSGHPGGSLSAVDVLCYLYFKELNIDPENPKWDDRDRFVLSKGHAAPALYSTLAHRGFFSVEDLPKLRHVNSFLQGHPNMHTVPGVDISTGSLGHGISCACGIALGAKFNGDNYRVYSLLGDGELQEGQVWEAFMFARHYGLDNLCVIIDNNGLQIDGSIEEVMNLYSIGDKLEAFGFHTVTVDGHDFEQIESALMEARTIKGKPTAIILKTVKGKGVSYMENNVGWHGKAPNDDEYAIAMRELSDMLNALERN